MEPVAVQPASSFLPDGLEELASRADAEGLRIVSTLIERWISGEERFDRPGETILAAVAGTGEVIGVGGLTICPTTPGALRVRRFYVHPAWRRQGAATALATAVVRHGLDAASTITCNAGGSAAAPPFWEAIGFEATSGRGITHVLRHPGSGA